VDVYYKVIDQIDGRSWKRFARTMLSIPDFEIDDIEIDHSSNVREQKYQMLTSWGKKSGNKI